MLSVKQCKIHIKSVNAITTPSLKKKFAEFVEFKKNHPREPFGSSDKPYSKSGNFSGYSHAHLPLVAQVVGTNKFKAVSLEMFKTGCK